MARRCHLRSGESRSWPFQHDGKLICVRSQESRASQFERSSRRGDRQTYLSSLTVRAEEKKDAFTVSRASALNHGADGNAPVVLEQVVPLLPSGVARVLTDVLSRAPRKRSSKFAVSPRYEADRTLTSRQTYEMAVLSNLVASNVVRFGSWVARAQRETRPSARRSTGRDRPIRAVTHPCEHLESGRERLDRVLPRSVPVEVHVCTKPVGTIVKVPFSAW
jgi:hypothetical protein